MISNRQLSLSTGRSRGSATRRREEAARGGAQAAKVGRTSWEDAKAWGWAWREGQGWKGSRAEARANIPGHFLGQRSLRPSPSQKGRGGTCMSPLLLLLHLFYIGFVRPRTKLVHWAAYWLLPMPACSSHLQILQKPLATICTAVCCLL